MSIMNKGRFTESFEKEKSDKRKRLRLGKNVPAGAANIAYIHTPNLTADDAVSFIDTAHVSDNTIPLSERESLAIADEQGYLQYAEVSNGDEVQLKERKEGDGVTSSNNFPTRDLIITNLFHDESLSLNNALYYQVSINYHYDKLVSESNSDGTFSPTLYKGNQIDITDLEGSSLLLNEELKAKIYVQGIFGYPNAYHVIVLLNKATTETETICIKYNHIDEPKNAQEIRTVKEKVQLYVDKKNLIAIDGKTKHMMESGKVRIINPEQAFLEKPAHEVINERTLPKQRSIYSIDERADGKGYQIIVPDRTEMDPRKAKHFQYMILAEYRNKQGDLVRHATGLIEDSLLHRDVLLSNERSRYSNDYKTIGLLNGQDILNARDSIESSLPITTPALPETTVYSIIDTEGNVHYSSTSNAIDKVDIESIVSDQYAMAKGTSLNTTNWPLANKANTLLKELPFSHRYSIIPEHQKTKWGFEYALDGEGEIHRKLSSRHSWQIRAHIGITLTNEPQVVNINDHNYWEGFGQSTTSGESKDKWNMEGDAIYFNDNLVEMNGFWQRTEESGRDLRSLKDYEFSTEVEVRDEYDDDLISVIFRVNDKDSFYAFVWERDDILLTHSSKNGVGRLFLSKHGLTAYKQSDADVKANKFWALPEGNSAKFLKAGFGDQHKHIFRVSKSSLPAASGTDADVGWTTSKNTRYPDDETGKSFEDITLKDSLYHSDAGKKGWKPNMKYRITVRVTGNNFAVYINDNPSSPYPGEKVLEGRDSSSKYENGSYGIAVMSQTKTYWRNLKLTEYESIAVDSDVYETQFKSKRKKLLIQKKVDLLMEPKINELFGPGKQYAESKFEIIGYEGITSAPIEMDVQPISKNIYGTPKDGIAGETEIVPWSTKEAETPLTVNGVGTVEYFSDGHVNLEFSPKIVPEIQLPEGIKNFKWGQPVITTGHDVSIKRVGKAIQVTAGIPKIDSIGKVWHSEDFSILSKDGMIFLNNIPNTNWREMFDIPADIPASEVMLRIERGHSADGITGINPVHSVNYRFRVSKGGVVRYPVDQFQDQLGMNRVRLKDIIDKKGMISEDIKLDTIAWTTQANYQSIPVYAVKLKEDRYIYAKPPRVEEGVQKHLGWYPIVKDGKMTRRIAMPMIKDINNPPALYKQYPSLIGHASTIDFQQELDFVYSIPEYRRQEFFNKPIVLVESERPRLLTGKSLQVKNQNIVTVRQKDQRYTNRVWVKRNQGVKEIGIKDIDAIKGIFYLLDYINEEDEVFVSYQYEEDFYEYRGFPVSTIITDADVNDRSVKIQHQASIKMKSGEKLKGPSIKEITGTDSTISFCYEDIPSSGIVVETTITSDYKIGTIEYYIDDQLKKTEESQATSYDASITINVVNPSLVNNSYPDKTQVVKIIVKDELGHIVERSATLTYTDCRAIEHTPIIEKIDFPIGTTVDTFCYEDMREGRYFDIPVKVSSEDSGIIVLEKYIEGVFAGKEEVTSPFDGTCTFDYGTDYAIENIVAISKVVAYHKETPSLKAENTNNFMLIKCKSTPEPEEEVRDPKMPYIEVIKDEGRIEALDFCYKDALLGEEDDAWLRRKIQLPFRITLEDLPDGWDSVRNIEVYINNSRELRLGDSREVPYVVDELIGTYAPEDLSEKEYELFIKVVSMDGSKALESNRIVFKGMNC